MPRQLETSEIPVNDVSNSKRDGLYLLILGAAVFVLFGFALQFSASDSREDFRAVVYGSRCLLHQCDPYQPEQLFRFYVQELGVQAASHFRSHTLTLYVNLPTTLLLTAPLAFLPFGISSLIWSVITAASCILASFLIWDLSSGYAPSLSAALIAISLMSAAIVLGNGNPAGIVTAFALVAVWCFLKGRFIAAGVLLLSVSLLLKPHDAGLVWLYFLLAGGKLRKHALQTLLVTALLSVVAVFWVSKAAPSWLTELRSNMTTMAARGGNNDPGPSGPTSRDRAIEMIVSLQSALSVIQDDPRFYNPITFITCGLLFVPWCLRVLRSPPSTTLTWLALAAIVPLTMLVTYHRAYDTRMLMLVVPACAMLAAEKRLIGKAATLVTILGFTFTSELPYALMKPLLAKIHIPAKGTGSLAVTLLTQPAPIVLLLMAGFFMYVFLRHSPQKPNQVLCASEEASA